MSRSVVCRPERKNYGKCIGNEKINGFQIAEKKEVNEKYLSRLRDYGAPPPFPHPPKRNNGQTINPASYLQSDDSQLPSCSYRQKKICP